MDEDLNAINETMIEDINTFPENISSALMGEEFSQCVEKMSSKEEKAGK